MNTDHLLCRAKRIDNGEWVKGYFVGPIRIAKHGDSHVIDPSTLQKCTGWRDKNGRLIFEGMYFKYEYEDKEGGFVDEIRKIFYSHDDCCFGVLGFVNGIWLDRDYFFKYYFPELEIFDNMRIKKDGTEELYND